MSEGAAPIEAERSRDLEQLLDHLKRTRGFDFTGYKRSSLERRINRRMEDVDITGYGEYLNYLEVHPDEFSQLFNTILINVTEFFRDRETWDYLRDDIVPQLVQSMHDDGPVRVWSAGCASGEEALSAAMLLVDALGEDAFRRRVKIYATDVDEEALTQARAATFTAKQMEGVPEELRERCFEPLDTRWQFRADLRRALIFGRNDLVQDAPISRIDLLLCRNTLMYFNAETQERILRRLNFALTDSGFLCLGRSEMLLTHAELFLPVNLQRRVFTKVSRLSLRDRLLSWSQDGGDDDDRGPVIVGDAVRATALDAIPMAQIVIDAEGTLVLANERSRALLGLGTSDLNRPIKDLTVSYRPVDLRSLLDAAYADRRATAQENVEWPGGPDRRVYNIKVTPLVHGTEIVGASITYEDVTYQSRLEADFERSRHELENAYEELQSTVEELETTNEELQSTNEELETTNEELQSTNEELETMNEELQSTNEELETANEELRVRGGELDEVNAFLEAILTSMRVGVVVVDMSQRVQIWNPAAEELWGLRAAEAEGHHLQSLDIGLTLDVLRTPVRDVLNGSSEREQVGVEAVNRRGKTIQCKISVLPMRRTADEISGAMVLMEAEPDG